MALRQHLTELKGRGKYFLENTRYKIRQYRLTRGSGRTEEIFGMSWTTKLFITLLVLILLIGVFYAGKILLEKKASGKPEQQLEEMVEESARAVATEPAAAREQKQEVAVEKEETRPEPATPSIDEEKERLSEEIKQLRRQKETFSPLLVDDDELTEAASLTILPEPFDVQGMGAACQVDIRDKESDLAGTAQFFREANNSYATVLEQVREPAETLRKAIEKLKAANAELNAKITTCVAEAPEQEPAPEPVSEPAPQFLNLPENQTNETA